MPRTKLTKDEKKEKKRVAERIRMEKIRKDPEKYALWQLKMKEAYLKRKKEGKIISVRDLTPKEQKIARKKSRESSRRWYDKKKLKKCIQSEQEEEEESIVDCNMEDTGTDDLLNFSSHEPGKILVSSRSSKSPSPIIPLSGSPMALRVRYPKSNVAHNSRSPKVLSTNAPVSDSPKLLGVRSRISSVLASPRSIRAGSPITTESCSPRSLSPQSSTSLISSPTHHIANPKRVKTAQPKITVKKKSPWKHLLHRFRYRFNKELQLKEQKILELKKINENFRKKIKRLEAYRKVKGMKNPCRQERQETNQFENNKLRFESPCSKIKEDVIKFLEEDDNSRICPGKKEFITKGKVKKQKRYLTESLQHLHKKFLETCNPQYKISYSSFCKLRPFWICIPNVNIRETCLCKDHENMDLVVAALRKNDLIDEKSTNQVLQSLCCDPRKIDCLARNCVVCKNKNLSIKEFDNSKETHYWIWNKVKKIYIKNGKEKTIFQTIKEKVAAHPKDIIEHFQNLLIPYMQHCGNIIEQYNHTKKLKENLKPEECIVHCDFSENYNTKYASEIQSFHFGSSRQQVTLHTSVIYFHKNGKLSKQSFCTVSKCLRHDAAAIWEHLLPILRFIENEVPGVTKFYFVSDSPSAQYRNRKMFYIMAKMHWYFPSLRLLVWNYSEKGHGKGAPDGVGGVLKRTADQIVARGNDISNIETLIKQLKDHCPGVILEEVDESGILEKDMLIPYNLKEFRGTMNLHQVVWSANQSDSLAMRKLSCNLDACLQGANECPHGQHIGFYNIGDIEERQTTVNVKRVNKNKPVTSKKTTCRSLIKRSQISAARFQSENDSDAAHRDLSLPKNDSFRVETLSIDQKIITPKFTNKVLSTLHQERVEDCIESDDEEIFTFKKPACDSQKRPPDFTKKTTCRSLVKSSQTSAARIQSENDSDTAHRDISLPEDDSFWAETSSIDEKIITPKFTREVLSTLHQECVDDCIESDDEEIFTFKKPQSDRQKKSSDCIEDNIPCSSRQQKNGSADKMNNSLIPCKKPRNYFFL